MKIKKRYLSRKYKDKKSVSKRKEKLLDKIFKNKS